MKTLSLSIMLLLTAAISGTELQLSNGRDCGKWYFHPGSEFPGAGGEFVRNGDDGSVIRYDFGKGGLYVSIEATGVDIPAETESVSFDLASQNDAGVIIRLADSNGRTFQSHKFAIPGGKTSTVSFGKNDVPAVAFGGSTQDNKLVNPIKNVFLLVEKTDGKPAAGTVTVSGLKAKGEKLTSQVIPPAPVNWQAQNWELKLTVTAGGNSSFLRVDATPAANAANAVFECDFPQMSPDLKQHGELVAAKGAQALHFTLPTANANNVYQIINRLESKDGKSSFVLSLPGKNSGNINFGTPKSSSEIKKAAFGTCVHLNYGLQPSFAVWKPYERILDAIAGCGMKYIRDNINVEKDPATGKYKIRDYDKKWLTYAKSKDLIPIVILWTDVKDGAEEYAKICGDIAVDAKGLVDIFELGNEPSNMGGWIPKFGGTWNAKEADNSNSKWMVEHLKYTNAGAEAIAKVRPEAMILGGPGCPPVTFRYLNSGMSNLIQGVVEHPYSYAMIPEKIPYGSTPEMVARDGIKIGDESFSFAGLIKSFQDNFDQQKSKRKLWITEFGFTTYRANGKNEETLYQGYTEAAQAAYLLRRELLTLGIPTIAASIQYDFVNDYDLPFEAEGNFGLLRYDLSPKPSYYVLQRFNSLLADSQTDTAAQVTVKAAPLHRASKRDSLIANWDKAKIAAENGIMTHAAKLPDNDRERCLAVWNLLPYSDEFNNRAVSLEITGWADWAQTPVAIDLITGRSFDLPAKLTDGRWTVENLSLGNHPVLIKFIR